MQTQINSLLKKILPFILILSLTKIASKANELPISSTSNYTNTSFSNEFLEEKISQLSKDFPNFGKKILNKFYLDNNYTNVNHGSFGVSPISVIEKLQQYQRELEFNPEKANRYDYLEKTNNVLKFIADYLDCNQENLVFIENASDGMNAVLKSLFAKSNINNNNLNGKAEAEKEKVLIFDIAYHSTKSIIQFLIDNYALEKIEFPVTEEILNYGLNSNEKEILDPDVINSGGVVDKANEANNLFKDFLLFNNLTLEDSNKTTASNHNQTNNSNYNKNKAKSFEIKQIKNSFFKNTFNKTNFLTKFEEFIITNLPIKAAIIDHISSTPAIVFPAKELTEILKKHKIISIIDGAHTIGQIDLSMRSINADFYISNFYKWFYAPKSASFLHINPAFQNKTHPNIISGQYQKGFKAEFSNTGTRDYSVYYSIKDALDFRVYLGDEKIKVYCRTLAYLAGNKIAQMWNTGILVYDRELNANMVNVLIPCDGVGFVCRSVEFVAKVVKETFDEFNTFVPTFRFSNGKYYARFSANVYNEIGDFVYAASKFLEVLRRNEKEKNRDNKIK